LEVLFSDLIDVFSVMIEFVVDVLNGDTDISFKDVFVIISSVVAAGFFALEGNWQMAIRYGLQAIHKVSELFDQEDTKEQMQKYTERFPEKFRDFKLNETTIDITPPEEWDQPFEIEHPDSIDLDGVREDFQRIIKDLQEFDPQNGEE